MDRQNIKGAAEKYIESEKDEIVCANDINEDKHWQDVRERASISALNGMLSNSVRTGGAMSEFADWAVKYADQLVERLKTKGL